jgi:hypothetical protein
MGVAADEFHAVQAARDQRLEELTPVDFGFGEDQATFFL